jgi:hypothetical protein
MSKKVYGMLKIKVVFDCDSPVNEVIENLEYSIVPDVHDATLVDSEIMEFEVTDSK